MNVAAILGKTYRLTNTDSATLLDGNSTNILAELNVCYGHRQLNILEKHQDINDFINEITYDLPSSIGISEGDFGYNGEIPFEADQLRPVRVEISYDGITWRPATKYDINDNNYSEFDQEDIQARFSEESPAIRFERDSTFYRPLKTTAGSVTDGIHIWYEKRQADLVTGSPAFESALHDVLSFDLAALESIMHPLKYSDAWRTNFNNERARIDEVFNSFFKNRITKRLGVRAKFESYR